MKNIYKKFDKRYLRSLLKQPSWTFGKPRVQRKMIREAIESKRK